MNKFLNIVKCALIFLISVTILFLYILSILSTASFGEYLYQGSVISNRTFYLRDNIWGHLIALFLFMIFVLILRRIFESSFTTKYFYFWGSIVISIIGIYFVCSFMLYPRADGAKILEIIEQVNNYDMTGFQPGSYMDINPQQNGFFIILYYIYCIVGDKTYFVWQIVNTVAISVTYYFVAKLTKNIIGSISKNTSLFTYLLCIMFVPYFFYVTFVYGNILGQMFCYISLYLTYETFQKKDIKIWILATVSMALAIFIKPNSLIFLVAIILYIIYQKLSKQVSLQKAIVLCAIMFAFVMTQNNYANMKIQAITGIVSSSGTPASAYVSMGLQENASANGWWNGYTWNIYRDNMCDTEVAHQAAVEDIKNEVNKMVEDPIYTLKFFIKKIASQWNNPEFGGIEILTNRMSRSLSTNTGAFFNESTEKVIFSYLNYYHSILLLGVILYFILYYRDINISNLLPAVVFLGGFIFHVFWEAMCQYAVPYMMLLLPYSAVGWLRLVNHVEDKLKIYRRINNEY